MAIREIAYWFSVLLIFIIPWESGATIEGIGPAARGIGLLAAGAWFGVVLVTGRMRRPHPYHLVVLLFLLWNVISLIWSVNVGDTLDNLETYVQLAVMTFLIWDLYTTPRKILIGMQAYVLGACVTVWSVMSNYLAGVTTGQSGRYSGFDFNENSLAMILVIGMCIAWYLAVNSNQDTEDEKSWARILRFINYAFVPLAIFSVILTASRTAMFSMTPFIWFMLGSVSRLKLSSRLLLTVGMIITLVFLQPLVPQTSLDRLSTTSSELTDGDLNGRRQIWAAGMEVFLEHPLTGMGGGVFKSVAGGKVAHNTYLSILTEMGMVGFALFMGMLLVALYQVKYQTRWMASLWLTVFLAWAIGVSSMTWEHRKPTWLIMAFVLTNGHALVQQMKETVITKLNPNSKAPNLAHSMSINPSGK